MRKLASIQRIASIRPIEGADAIEVARVNNWDVVVKKGEFEIGDLAIYFEIDSFLPVKEEFEFLRKSSYKLMGDVEGFRLRTVKLRGQVSQGLLLPTGTIEGNEGDDVTDLLGVVKYEPPIPAQLAGQMKGAFPSFIKRTDEERVQNLTAEYEEWKSQGIKWVATEKLDGSSATFYLNNGEFGVCSRNIDLLETEGNSFWKAAQNLDIEAKMRNLADKFGSFALQGELIGEGIQGNPYSLKGQDVRFFSIWSIDERKLLSVNDLQSISCLATKFQTVPTWTMDSLPSTIDELLAMADGESALNPKAKREGLVIRSVDSSISFKVISNQFLLKSKD